MATWYRPLNSSTESFAHFESLVGKLDAENAEFYLMGDMNCNLATSNLDHNANFLRNITDVYGLQQLINDPTRGSDFSCT